jgi:hypothetical protein
MTARGFLAQQRAPQAGLAAARPARKKETPAETGSRDMTAISAGASRHHSGKKPCGGIVRRSERSSRRISDDSVRAHSQPKARHMPRPHFRAGTGSFGNAELKST